MPQRLTEKQIQEIEDAINSGMSFRQIAKQILGRESRKSTVSDLAKRLTSQGYTSAGLDGENKPKIAVIDIETSMEKVYSFRRFKAFISPEQVIERAYILSYSAVFLDSPKVISRNLTDFELFKSDISDDYELVKDIWHFLNAVDVIIAHNGVKFDQAYINQRFAYHGFAPPSPYKVVDTLKAVKKVFALPSNALKEACLYFETENFKLDNSGVSLWIRCMNGDVSAFEEMQEYNDGDVVSLKDLYLKLLAWIPQHPNVSAYYEDNEVRCPRCGSTDIEVSETDAVHTQVSSFQLISCNNCGGHSRGRVNLRSKEKRNSTIIPV